jgi:hypothetical protein
MGIRENSTGIELADTWILLDISLIVIDKTGVPEREVKNGCDKKEEADPEGLGAGTGHDPIKKNMAPAGLEPAPSLPRGRF